MSFFKSKAGAVAVFLTLLMGFTGILTTCGSPMGLGDPVDINPPLIYIENPGDNAKKKSITQGQPLHMDGFWADDNGVTSLEFEILDSYNGNKPVIPTSITYKLTKDPVQKSGDDWVTGTWTAEIVIDTLTGDAKQYEIVVYALDHFRNKGRDRRLVQMDIVSPWVEDVVIQRHPDHPVHKDTFVQKADSYGPEETGSKSKDSAGNDKKDSLPNREYYVKKGFDFNSPEAWRDITYEDQKLFKIDEFQNEFFRLSAQLDAVFEVGASRLEIYREVNGEEELLNENLLKPSGFNKPTSDPVFLKYPYWDIDKAQLTALNAGLSSGPTYIFFKIRAWTRTDWSGPHDTGSPVVDPADNKPEEGRTQRIGGTVWYPESDNPHPYIEKDLIVGDTNTIILQLNTTNALMVDFYDDDKLSEIYLGLLPIDNLRTLMSSAGTGTTEAQYFASLATDAGRRTNVMDACITNNTKNNLYAGANGDISGNQNRLRTFGLTTAGEGEFRLIAMVKEGAKDEANYSYTETESKYSVYPPLRVQVQSAAAPLIIVQNPLKENAFPTMDQDGEHFRFSGYTLAGSKVETMYIAWGPGQTQAQCNAAINSAFADETFTTKGTSKAYGAVTVWLLDVTDQGEADFSTAGNKYYKSTFSQRFHIVNDFLPIGSTTSEFKGSKNNTFVIRAISQSQTDATKNFPLLGSSAPPAINVVSHTSNTTSHDRGKDLVLKMQLTPGTDGVKVMPNSWEIEDITNPANAGFTGPVTSSGIEYFRTVPTAWINNNFSENSTREYRFRAKSILDNQGEIPKFILMSNSPLIQSVTCTNGTGTYAEGETLTFDVEYNMPVLVKGTGTPRLKLYFLRTNAEAATPPAITNANGVYATFIPNPQASNNLQFTYTVKRDDSSARLSNPLSPIDLNGAQLEGYNGSATGNTLANLNKCMQYAQTVQLDGIHPTVTRASFTYTLPAGMDRMVYSRNKNITLSLLWSEPVMVDGAPRAYIWVKGQTGTNYRFTAEYSSKSSDGRTLNFIYTVPDSPVSITAETLLIWGQFTSATAPFTAGTFFEAFAAGEGIADAWGNKFLDITANTAAPSEANRQGSTATGYPTNQEAYIKTSLPAKPTITIHTTQAGAQAANATTAVQAGTMVSARNGLNGNFLLRAGGIETAGSTYTVYYSLTGGSNAKTNLVAPTTGTANYRYSNNTTTGTANNSIPDPNYSSRTSRSYTPTSYQITVWQTDRAGNESPKETRELIINSRPADLSNIDINLQNGSYPAKTVVPFKLSFAQKITANANATVTLIVQGTDSQMNSRVALSPITVARTTDANPATSLITLNWTVPDDVGSMKNIKVKDIQFSNLVDEYTNSLIPYNGTAAEADDRRPIGDDHTSTTPNNYTFQLNRPDLIILSNRPTLVASQGGDTTTPVMPAADGANRNGGIPPAPGYNVLKLVFVESGTIPVALTAVPGKYITIRPYGTWAIPPDLTVEEFNNVKNHANVKGNATYVRRLSDVDLNEMPNTGSGRGSGYNLYRKNTHGITNASLDAGNVRPDTTTKMILDFTTDLYEGTNASNLREIFNAAEWKHQKILVTSDSVGIGGTNNNVITLTIPGALDKGRIWEVVIEDGAFQDKAGNLSNAVAAGTYRFWSPGTATPYIRADKVSYDNRGDIGVIGADNVTLGFVSAATNGIPRRPPVDMRVRIDCETPGADIRYDVIRTHYTLANAFSGTGATNTAFFNHTGISGITTNTGYQNNTIGNDDAITYKTAGFLNRVLVPNTVQTGTAALANGTIPMSALDTLGSPLTGTTGGSANVRQYQTYAAATGARTWGDRTWSVTLSGIAVPVIYVGELWGDTTNPTIVPTTNTDARFYSGRRDYVVARAKKAAVTGNTANLAVTGPALDQSLLGMEGVYKTTLLYRDPYRNAVAGNTATSGRLARLLVQGYDTPVMAVVAGFPLRDADVTNATTDAYSNYFSKSAWRYGTGNTYDTWTATTLNNDPEGGAPGNNHIWVSWEIVTDWYQKGKGFRRISGNYLNNNNTNTDAVAASYGAVIYRYQQPFYQ
jgi:hypothetical protein